MKPVKPISSVPKLALLLLAFLVSCSSNYNSQTSSQWTLAHIYNPLKSSLHPLYKVYHNNTNTSVLFFKLRTDEIFFRPNAFSNEDGCSFTLKYMLQEIGDGGNFLVDTNTFVYQFNRSDLGKFYISQIPFKATEGKSYRMKITLRDNFRLSHSIYYLDIEKQAGMGEQYFNITGLDGTPVFRNILVNDGLFRVQHASPASTKLYIFFYHNQVQASKPFLVPLSDELIYSKPDSMFIVDYSANTALSLVYQGLYYIRFDTLSTAGVCLLRLSESFPQTKKPEELIPPLTYITTDAEFDKLKSEINPKLAADNFWQKTAGSIDRGREMIRLYYNRVYYSNYYFSSTREGWKTDRGMVYVVYGPPEELKKTPEQEIWIYKNKTDNSNIVFTFNYEPNRYNLNNYKLERSQSESWRWTETVYTWTSGQIFNTN